MFASETNSPVPRPAGHLIVDSFLTGLVEARILARAFDLGLIDLLATEADTWSLTALQREVEDRSGPFAGFLQFAALVEMLRANDVVLIEADRVRLTQSFRAALDYRELLEVKIDVGCRAARDIAGRFDDFVMAPNRFAEDSEAFNFFDYATARDRDAAAIEVSRRWASYLTLLTRYEAPALIDRYDFSARRQLLDIGGNTGELALQLCRRHPDLRATVFDLPAVAEIARDRLVNAGPGGERIRAVGGDALVDDLPGGNDVVTMKSFLHDWSGPSALRLIRSADRALQPGGTLLIVERSTFGRQPAPIPFSLWPIMLYSVAMPGPARYQEMLSSLGYLSVEVDEFELDTPWFALTATKPSERAAIDTGEPGRG